MKTHFALYPQSPRLALYVNSLLGFLIVAIPVDAAIVRGRLIHPKGDPVVEARVRVVSATIGPSQYVFSGEDGMFYLNGIPPGSYTLEIIPANGVTIRAPVLVRDPITDNPPVTIPVPSDSNPSATALTQQDPARLKQFDEIVDGDWQGTPDGLNIPLVFHISKTGGTTVDSPAQNAFGIPGRELIDETRAIVNIPLWDAVFSGSWDGTRLVGKFSQHSQSFPLVLQKIGPKDPSSQTPIANSNNPAASLMGDWQGTPEGLSIPIVFHIGKNGDSTADSPSQRAFGAPATVSLNGNAVKFTIPIWGVEVNGSLIDTAMAGFFVQYGKNFPIVLRKVVNTDDTTSAASNFSVSAKRFNGIWSGTPSEFNIPIVFHINLNGTSTVDSPVQSASGIPVKVLINGNTATFSVPGWGLAFRGGLQGDSIVGTVSQNGRSFLLTLDHSL